MDWLHKQLTSGTWEPNRHRYQSLTKSSSSTTCNRKVSNKILTSRVSPFKMGTRTKEIDLQKKVKIHLNSLLFQHTAQFQTLLDESSSSGCSSSPIPFRHSSAHHQKKKVSPIKRLLSLSPKKKTPLKTKSKLTVENRPQVQTPPPSSVDNTEDSGDDQYIYDEDDLRLTFMVLNLNVQL